MKQSFAQALARRRPPRSALFDHLFGRGPKTRATVNEPAGTGENTAEAFLRECPGCGLFQMEPALVPGTTAQCERCRTTLRRSRQHPLEHSLALALASLILLTVMCLSTLMTVRTSGIVHHAGIFSGPMELVQRRMSALAIVVVFVTVVAPLCKLIGTIYVLLRIRETRPPPHLRRVFALVERLSTWSMVEVFVLGVFVAYVKLGDLVTIELNAGVYALFALTIALVWADAALDREAVWDALDSKGVQDVSREVLRAGQVPPHAVGCEICTLVVIPAEQGAPCPRCGSALHSRKPDSIAWTWALVIAAAVCTFPPTYTRCSLSCNLAPERPAQFSAVCASCSSRGCIRWRRWYFSRVLLYRC